jgi:hypothetical protein
MRFASQERIMSDQSFDDLVKARDRLVVKLRRRPKRAAAISPEERQAQLTTAVARLQAATRGKEEAIQRYDEEIRQYADLVSQFEAEVAKDQKRAPEKDGPH